MVFEKLSTYAKQPLGAETGHVQNTNSIRHHHSTEEQTSKEKRASGLRFPYVRLNNFMLFWHF